MKLEISFDFDKSITFIQKKAISEISFVNHICKIECLATVWLNLASENNNPSQLPRLSPR